MRNIKAGSGAHSYLERDRQLEAMLSKAAFDSLISYLEK